MGAAGSTDTSVGGSVISLPSGGGAVAGLGEKFAPDLFTGTGNFSVPVALPAGRSGLAPRLSLDYSTGSGNSAFGLGWQLSIPVVTRKTSKGIPRYADAAGPADVFVLSGAEDLVPVAGSYPGRVRYRPRTEGLFARIEHVRDDSEDFWEVRTRDGMLTRYGTPRPAGAAADWADPAVVADPADPGRVFGWRITETRDPLGNLVRYAYRRDQGQEPGHRWDQPLIAQISYADYGDRAAPSFLVAVEFDYEPRPDPWSDRRPGFEVRTSLRCRAIRVVTRAADGVTRVAREHRLTYQQAEFSGISLLTRVDVVGIDEAANPGTENLPPLTYGYSGFDPAGRRFEPLTGPALPTAPLTDPTLALVDLQGVGLPDVVELGAAHRYWRNAGGGRFERPRSLVETPPLALGQPSVRFADADGDGRPDLLVTATAGGPAGYYPLAFGSGWSRRSFQRYPQAPAVSLADPAVKLVDLDGDGLTDVLRSGTRLHGWFNDADPERAWQRNAPATGTPPQVDLADPRIRLADMTGDGLTDLVLLRSGNVAYWPNLGHNRWGPMVTMRRAPRLPERYDPRRLLLGDLDGAGSADLVYVDDGRVLIWANRSGNAWSEQPVTVTGTPILGNADALELADLHGTGTAGILFSRAGDGSGRQLRFLDVTGGVKPYLLDTVDNHLGSVTRVGYRPSTVDYLRDRAEPTTRWRTTLPFPVQVVGHVEVLDAISGGRLTTEYRYHHGYWDGVEREFRGFAMVEHFDTETFGAPTEDHSPPTVTRSWFHPGPVAAVEAGDWTELDLRHEYWAGDAPMLFRPAELTALLAAMGRDDRRSALRAMRGRSLRTEVYALDGSARADRPYTVTESVPGIREESPAGPGEARRPRIFFSFALASRTTHWERGTEPMTRFEFSAGYDAYGMATGQVAIAVPRGRDPMTADPAATEPYLATYAVTEYARRDDAEHYLVDRVARTTSYEIVNDGRPSVLELRDAVLGGSTVDGLSTRVIGHGRTFYDGDAFVGLPLGELGGYGLPVRSESLAFADAFLDDLYRADDPAAVSARPVYLNPGGVAAWPAEYPTEFRALLPPLAGYLHYRDADVPGSPGGYYVAGARHRYDVQEPGRVPRGLPVASLDPLGAVSRVEYDQHDLLPVRTVDPVGLETLADNDYRVLHPHTLTDVNGNTISVTFSPVGQVTATFIRGKDGHGDGTEPSTRITYDLLAFDQRGQPASVRTERRVHHDTETGIPAGERDAVVVSVQYSDGFGRVLQTRSLAEDTLFGDPAFGGDVLPADQSAPDGDTVGRTRPPSTPDNVLVSGWQVYDNKGQVARKYEPFFAVGYDYDQPGEAQLGRSTALFRDPRGHVVRTVRPDGSEERVVLGIPADRTDPDGYAPTPWETYGYDANDNAGRTHGDAASAYREHWDTPASTEIDALGRTVRSVVRNGPEPADWSTIHTTVDIQGNVVAIRDPLGREAFGYRYDLAQRQWRSDSIDSGRHDTVLDALGRPFETRDGKGAFTLAAFDLVRRPIRWWARDEPAGPVTLRQVVEYGDGGAVDQPAANRAAARALNLLGTAVRQHDEAGLVTLGAADFKGNVLESTRRVIADGPILAGYDRARDEGWQVAPFQVDWTSGPGADREADLLEPNGYVTTTSYDALNRVVSRLFPADVEGRRRELRPAYDRAGMLRTVTLDGTGHVRRIAYDAKGQRTVIAYGNGVLTRYAYDSFTFRLVRLRSERYDTADDVTYRSRGTVTQDCGYDWDLVGNLVALRDRAPGSGIPNNPAALGETDPVLRRLLGSGDALTRRFGYDPSYRLLTATGREQSTPPGGDPWIDLPRGTDVTLAQPYTETYHYDAAGGLLSLGHASAGGFTRTFAVAPDSNRLQRTTVGDTQYDYAYDRGGNLLGEASTRHFRWNHADRLATFGTQTPSAEPSVHAHYLYDPAGQRVKKFVRRQGGAVEVTHYLGGAFEHHRWTGPAAGANNHLHVMDDRRRVALVRVGPPHPDDRNPAVAVHLADHLGSSTVVVDGAGATVNREEYSPYGETSFGSYARKRYRFTGQERDEESGLAYHSARYLHPALGRWLSCDPNGAAAGLHSYEVCGGNPMNRTDIAGTEWEFTLNPREWAPLQFAGEEVVPRASGALKVVGGAAGFVAGELLCDTGVGCAVGAPLMVMSADVAGSGAMQMVKGSPAPTVLGTVAGPTVQRLEEDFVGAAAIAYTAAQGTVMWKTGSPLARTTPAPPPPPASRQPNRLDPGVHTELKQPGSALNQASEAAEWRNLPGGVRIKQVGSVWVKEVNSNASSVARWWGRGSLEAQSRGLDKLGDMSPGHSFASGTLITADAGAYADGGFWRTWLEGSKRLGTPFNDIRPRNIGAGGVIFDPAKHPVQQALEAVTAAATVGAVGSAVHDRVSK